jgi:urocanate hydratase
MQPDLDRSAEFLRSDEFRREATASGDRARALIIPRMSSSTLSAAAARTVRAQTGGGLRCPGWLQEAALRMLENNLDPDVAERPDDLIVYGGTGRAARSWEAFDSIVATLKRLKSNQTMLVQSGKAGRRLRDARGCAAASSSRTRMLVPAWATGDEFRRLEGSASRCTGQMTAAPGSTSGSQGIVQGTYETFAAAGRKEFGSGPRRPARRARPGSADGRSAAARRPAMAGAVALVAEVDPERIEKAAEDALPRRERDRTSTARSTARSRRGLRGAPSRSAVEAERRSTCSSGCSLAGIVPGPRSPTRPPRTTSSNGYVPRGGSLAELTRLRRDDPKEYIARRTAPWPSTCARCSS